MTLPLFRFRSSVLWMLSLLFLTGHFPGVASVAKAKATTKPAPTWLLGVATRQWKGTCPTRRRLGSKPIWSDPHTQVGFVRLVEGSVQPGKALFGKPVLVKGRGLSGTRPRWQRLARPCGPMQMRGDYRFGRNGFRIVRRLPGSSAWLPRFKASAVKEWKGVSLQQRDGKLTFALSHKLPFSLRDVTLTMHYEGCFGKPFSRRLKKKFALVKPGQRIQWSVPSIKVEKRKRRGYLSVKRFRGSSLQLTTASGQIIVDLTLPLSSLTNRPPRCPSRRRR